MTYSESICELSEGLIEWDHAGTEGAEEWHTRLRRGTGWELCRETVER